jgi:nitrate reductase NapAB chaperone NapD
VTGAQQRQHHLAVEEAAAVEQRKHELDVRPVEQRLIFVREDEVQAEALQNLAYLDMVEGVIAVLRVKTALP